nr:STM3941 family protein [Rufibacter sp. SYSU D00308]
MFFGGVAVYGVRKFFDKAVGLVIDQAGITDNTNAASAGRIEWADITHMELEQVMSTKFLLLYTHQPDKYLNRATGLKRKLLQGNLNMYGTPLVITSNTLACNFETLEALLQEKLRQQQQIQPHAQPNWHATHP